MYIDPAKNGFAEVSIPTSSAAYPSTATSPAKIQPPSTSTQVSQFRQRPTTVSIDPKEIPARRGPLLPFVCEVARVLRTIDPLISQAGATLDPQGERPLNGGTLSRLWNSSRFSKLWRHFFPRDIYDVIINREGPSGLDQVEMCRIEIRQGFGGKIHVKVRPFGDCNQQAMQITKDLFSALSSTLVTGGSTEMDQSIVAESNPQSYAPAEVGIKPFRHQPPLAEEALYLVRIASWIETEFRKFKATPLPNRVQPTTSFDTSDLICPFKGTLIGLAMVSPAITFAYAWRGLTTSDLAPLGLVALFTGFLIGRSFANNEARLRMCLSRHSRSTTHGSIGHQLSLFEKFGYSAKLHLEKNGRQLRLSVTPRQDVAEDPPSIPGPKSFIGESSTHSPSAGARLSVGSSYPSKASHMENSSSGGMSPAVF